MQWVDHTDQVIGVAYQLQGLIINMENALRGHVNTGEEEFLQPYNEAKSTIDSRFEVLDRLVSDNPPQQARLATIRSRFDQWRISANDVIVRRQKNGVEDYESTLQRKQLMDSIRAERSVFTATEERLRCTSVRSICPRWPKE
ncbi:MAG: CHASE3 domain-containing protein [Terriglobales bacterium]|jgi:CHASE3 domain sensor protein